MAKIHPSSTKPDFGRTKEHNESSRYLTSLYQLGDRANLLKILDIYHYEHQTMEDDGGTGELFDPEEYNEWLINNDSDKVAIIAKAAYDHEIVGFLLMQKDNGMPELVGTHWAITDFFVNENHREKGVGRKLIQHASTYCIEDGRYDILEASSVLSNKKASNFYLSLGFKIVSKGYEFLDRANHRGHGKHVVHIKKLK
jgi:ribosomal protein S18 acetylase RimI-like enzyme